MLTNLFLIVVLLTPNLTYQPSARKNRKSTISNQAKKKRTVRRLRKRNVRKNKSKYQLKRRRKAGGTYNRKRVVQKPKPKPVRKLDRRNFKMTPLQRQILQLQMGVLLNDPEMGHIYRQIIKRENKKKGKRQRR